MHNRVISQEKCTELEWNYSTYEWLEFFNASDMLIEPLKKSHRLQAFVGKIPLP